MSEKKRAEDSFDRLQAMRREIERTLQAAEAALAAEEAKQVEAAKAAPAAAADKKQ